MHDATCIEQLTAALEEAIEALRHGETDRFLDALRQQQVLLEQVVVAAPALPLTHGRLEHLARVQLALLHKTRHTAAALCRLYTSLQPVYAPAPAAATGAR
jgi:hypothetical protein